MKDFEFKVHEAAFREIRTSAQVEAFVKAEAEAVADAAGPGFAAVRAGYQQNRVRYFVGPQTPEAYRANYTDLAVLRGLQSRAR